MLLAAALTAVATLYLNGGFAASDDFHIRVSPRRAAAGPLAGHDAAPTPDRSLVASHLFQIVARRGDCWLVVRQSSARGAVLYEGLLAAGQAVRLKRAAIWISAGAAANLDVLIDGKPLAERLSGTIETVLPARGRSA